MIVRCDNCGTEFGFDQKQVGEGVTVRCSVCKNVFKVESPGGQPTAWMVRTTEDTNFSAPDAATLREWISEGRLHPDDQLSRTGRKWVRLGDMPEFSDVFRGFAGIPAVVTPVSAPPVRHEKAVGPIPPATTAGSHPPSGPARQQPPPAPQPRVAQVQSQAAGATLPPTPAQSAGSASFEGTDVRVGAVAVEKARSPQSQQATISPPRSVPAQSAAPVSAPAPAAAADEELLNSGDDFQPPAAARSWGGLLADNPDELEDAPTRVRSRSPEPEPEPEPALELEPASDPDFGDDEDDEDDDDEDGDDDDSETGLDAFAPPPRRGINPAWLVLGLLGAVGVGVVLFVPQVRNQALALIQGSSAEQPSADAEEQPRPELLAAQQATQQLGVVGAAKAEVDLQRALDAGDAEPSTQVAMKVALADLLLSRALAYEIAAAIDPEKREDYKRRAGDDQTHGERLVDSIEGGGDLDRLAEVRVLARLAGGRDASEVQPMVPAGATQTELIVKAAVLWRDDAAGVPLGLVGNLQGLSQRSGLAESALGLALLRAGDETAARNSAERLLTGASDQIVGLALRAKIGDRPVPLESGETQTGESEGAETGDGDGDSDTGDSDGEAKPLPLPNSGNTGGGGTGGGGGGGGGFDRLLERGCEQVRSGEAAAAVKTLLRAFDRQPKNVDVLVCLGDAYASQSNNGRAGHFYERALELVPANRGALKGAAKIAAKTGAKKRATDYYTRLLEIEPNNAAAKAFLDKNNPEPKPEPEPAPAPAPAPSEGTPEG